jgi:hypothetical protein
MSVPKMPMIIAICGAKRSGKDVLAQHLVDKYNYERVAFAQPLKLAMKSLFNFDDDQVGIGEDKGTGRKDIVDERWGITPRTALQFFGTEIMQEKIQEILPDMKKNFFANTLKNYIADKIKINPDQRFVISDLRFIHEYEALFSISKIRKDEIAIIRVIRPSSSLSSGSPVDDSSDLPKAHISEPKAHISELEYMNIPYDIILINNGSIESYIDKFDKIIRI